MSNIIVFTFIGTDRPGLVEKISNTVTENGGNWLESHMSKLAGHFTGIARVQVNSQQVDALQKALNSLSSDELTLSIHPDREGQQTEACQEQQLSLLGNDRPGIVRELSRALAALNINICEMESRITSAPMTAEPLFEASALIHVPLTLNKQDLADQLEEIANELSVDITLED